MSLDRETYLDRLGEDLEPGGREPAPPPLRVVQKFINTHNHELPPERDRLGDPAAAARWLIANSLLDPGETLTEGDIEKLKQAREALRTLAGAGLGESSSLDGVEAPLKVRLDDTSSVLLEPAARGLERALGTLLVIVHDAMIDGSWERMKPCRQCSWLFYDHSRNRSGSWCSMSICGNRAKNRAYRQRSED